MERDHGDPVRYIYQNPVTIIRVSRLNIEDSVILTPTRGEGEKNIFELVSVDLQTRRRDKHLDIWRKGYLEFRRIHSLWFVYRCISYVSCNGQKRYFLLWSMIFSPILSSHQSPPRESSTLKSVLDFLIFSRNTFHFFLKRGRIPSGTWFPCKHLDFLNRELHVTWLNFPLLHSNLLSFLGPVRPGTSQT